MVLFSIESNRPVVHHIVKLVNQLRVLLPPQVPFRRQYFTSILQVIVKCFVKVPEVSVSIVSDLPLDFDLLKMPRNGVKLHLVLQWRQQRIHGVSHIGF